MIIKERTSDKIIELLREKPGLRMKEIFFELKKQGGKTTAQNIHKTLKSLKGEGIVIKSDIQYKLSRVWIQKIKRYAAKL